MADNKAEDHKVDLREQDHNRAGNQTEGHKTEAGNSSNDHHNKVEGHSSKVAEDHKVDLRDKIHRVQGHNRAGNKTGRSKGLLKTDRSNAPHNKVEDHRNKVQGQSQRRVEKINS